jgi:hypothetical protein
VVKFSAMPSNELYLTALPLVRVPVPGVVRVHGLVEQFITLFPDRNFATEFYEDEVQFYIDAFKASIPALTGGHSKAFEFTKEPTVDGERVIVRVVQHVA